ncbi:MAG: hypothetical protein K8Q99_00920 [Acholeplasmataceae bacterium]|nr:hypothetical protein [Acholeplasmataceae bacterium]
MDHYQIPWSFYFQFNQDKQVMHIYLSNLFKTREAIPNNYYVLSYEDVEKFLHKYDMRKLNYFFDKKITNTFDMVLKVKDFTRKKGYINLHALCYIDQGIMHCVSIDVMEVIKIKKMLDKHILDNDVHLDIRNQEYEFKEIKNNQIDALEEHLFDLIYKKYTN